MESSGPRRRKRRSSPAVPVLTAGLAAGLLATLAQICSKKPRPQPRLWHAKAAGRNGEPGTSAPSAAPARPAFERGADPTHGAAESPQAQGRALEHAAESLAPEAAPAVSATFEESAAQWLRLQGLDWPPAQSAAGAIGGMAESKSAESDAPSAGPADDSVSSWDARDSAAVPAEQSAERADEQWRDPQTGLARYRLLEDRIDVALKQARRQSHSLAVLMFDSPARRAGERQLLAAFAQRIRKAVRESDTLGIDQRGRFVALISLTNASQIVQPVQRVLAALLRPAGFDGGTGGNASIGISLYPADAQSAEELLAHAQAALEQAREAGANGYRIFAAA